MCSNVVKFILKTRKIARGDVFSILGERAWLVALSARRELARLRNQLRIDARVDSNEQTPSGHRSFPPISPMISALFDREDFKLGAERRIDCVSRVLEL